ncbi:MULTISPECIES: hypothetical protein [unclassified Nitrospina]|uniref:hypothetical protein n=1 Tax=unclassified Nitrospina TaxID=2638683 RepID=UPI003F977655
MLPSTNSPPLSLGLNRKNALAWFQRHPELLEDVKQAIKSFRWLRVVINGNAVCVKGTLEIVKKRYKIEITFPDYYPETLPILRETGGKIPRTMDRHVNPPDGTACICVPEEWFVQRPDPSFATFLKIPVTQYFLSQQHFEINNQWPFGHRRHRDNGRLDFYRELFETNDLGSIRKYLKYLSQKTIKGHWECPCGSGKRLRNCHKEKVYDLRNKIPRGLAHNSEMQLRAHFLCKSKDA